MNLKEKFKRNKGITLIALVITIIVLLILAGVTINVLFGDNGILNKAQNSSIETDISTIKEQIQIDIIEKLSENNGNISDDNLKEILEKYGTLSEEEKLTDKTLTTKEGNYEIKVSDIWNGNKNPVIVDKSGASAPTGDITGKIYVTWELNKSTNTYEEIETQEQPDNWYDYENGKWANIKTTNNGLEAYWVWIPRYEYVVPTSTTATEIEVKFISKDQTTPDTDKDYVIHPAFTNEGNGGFGELDGIWVAKFESSSNIEETYTNCGGGDNTTLKVQVKPGVISWRGIRTNNMFTVCRKMTSEGEVLEGSTVDSHMMKNTEWGAVAILSQSKYGILNSQSSTGANGDATYQVWNNSSISYITGSVGTSKDDKEINKCSAYNSANGPKASTTGTVYGVYDMAGGSGEYVAGCLSGQENAEFGVTAGDRKYVDLYINSSNSNSNYDGAKIGDATKETKGWNSDYSKFVYSGSPIFCRGRLYGRR